MKEHPLICDQREVRGLFNGSVSLIVRPVRPQPASAKDIDAIRAALRGEVVFGKPPWCFPGDHLWVRETWRKFDRKRECPCYEACQCPPSGTVIYREVMEDGDDKWRPSSTMPRWASRLSLDVVSVKVVRLWSITDAQALRAGATQAEADAAGVEPRDEFSRIWEARWGKRYPWASNPWVWLVCVEREVPHA